MSVARVRVQVGPSGHVPAAAEGAAEAEGDRAQVQADRERDRDGRGERGDGGGGGERRGRQEDPHEEAALKGRQVIVGPHTRDAPGPRRGHTRPWSRPA